MKPYLHSTKLVVIRIIRVVSIGMEYCDKSIIFTEPAGMRSLGVRLVETTQIFLQVIRVQVKRGGFYVTSFEVALPVKWVNSAIILLIFFKFRHLNLSMTVTWNH